ncbi:MAG: hypothetical protein ACP5PA_05205 [Elusimicrobiales bacterium]
MIGIVFFVSIKILAIDFDENLSKTLLSEYTKCVSAMPYGKKILKEAQGLSKHIYLDYSDDGWLAWYEGGGKIFFNLKYLMIFFGIEDYDKEKVIKVIKNSPDVRKEFVRYTDFLFVHELVHLIQDSKYPYFSRYRYEFAELEYEAFIKTDIYFYEKMKKNKTLFYKILASKYYDIYSGYAMGGFISSFDFYDNYLESIKKRYLDEAEGYVSLTEEEQRKKIRLEERRLLSYAGADKSIYERDKKDYDRMKKDIDVYMKNISIELKKIWEKYTDEAFYFVLDMSYKAENQSVFWRAFYFLKNLKNKGYSDKKKERMIERFKNHIKGIELEKITDDGVMSLVEEIYWFEKNFSSLADYDEIRHSIYPQIIARAIKISDSYDKRYSDMIDFISSAISIW